MASVQLKAITNVTARPQMACTWPMTNKGLFQTISYSR